jgi:1-acyl-sn-glycerol-3-phosphate acyltransferase
MMGIVKRFLLEPIDDYFVGQQKILQRFGVDQTVNSQIYKTTDQLFYGLFKNRYNFDVFDADNIPKEGRVILCCNHQSFIDPIVFGVASCHFSGRKMHQMAKVELFETPLVDAFIRAHFAFPVRRGKHDVVSYEKAKELLEQDQMVGIYPEGTINDGGGKFLEPHVGAARLAYETNSPILPVAIYGTDRVYGKNAKYPKLDGNIHVKFGHILNFEKLFSSSDPSNPKFYQKAINKVMRRIQDMYFDLAQPFMTKSS